MANLPFSQDLDNWLDSNKPKTFAGLLNVAAEKSFALLFLVCMAIPALPLPTGGITYIFEFATILVAIELIVGRKTIWLPQKLLKRPLGKTITTRTLPYLVRKIRWFEKHSRPRMSALLNQRDFLRLVGLFVLLFAIGSALAPPFSGLDTIPALGVLIIALSLILEDIAGLFVGILVGIVGIIIEIGLATIITAYLTRLL